MKISDRLLMSASMVTKGNIVADIGCDHGYSSIYLLRHGITNRAIAMDLREGPLARAAANIELYGCKDMIETRLSDGIDKLEPGEADTILMAGMGGKLMIEILQAKPETVNRITELVLQPQSDVGDVRRYIYSIGFSITDEDMCIEDGKYYVAMRAVNQKNYRTASKPHCEAVNESENVTESKYRESEYSDTEYEFGRILLNKKHNILKAYLEEEYRKARLILGQLEASDTKNAKERLPEYRSVVELLESGLQHWQ